MAFGAAHGVLPRKQARACIDSCVVVVVVVVVLAYATAPSVTTSLL